MEFQDLIDFECIKENPIINAKFLPSRECDTLIKENIAFEWPNYYQINSFVNTLSGQFKRFSINFALSAGNLIQCGNV